MHRDPSGCTVPRRLGRRLLGCRLDDADFLPSKKRGLLPGIFPFHPVPISNAENRYAVNASKQDFLDRFSRQAGPSVGALPALLKP
jgi:hypothetical protein